MIDKYIQEHLTTHMVNAAIRAGAAIMEIYNSETNYEITLKSDNSPITTADRAAHNAIKETLSPTRIPIMSEEGREMLYNERKNWEMFWLVDPLDGTVEFINRNNEFTVNIALMYRGRALASAIYVPYFERLYIAGEGYGTHLAEGVAPDINSNLNYTQISSNLTPLPIYNESRDSFRVAVSRSHVTPETYIYINKLRNDHPDLEIIEQGSSYKFCMLADGSIDYYIRTSPTYEWDTAAGELILSEVGGVTRAVDGTSLQYNKESLKNPWFECYR